MKWLTGLALLWLLIFGIAANAQAPAEYLRKQPPSVSTKVVRIAFVNGFDGSPGEALLEIPARLKGAAPLIVCPHPANWTPEMNRSLWSGVADDLGVYLLHPIHQGKTNPRVSLGSQRQMGNLDAAITAIEKSYPIDRSRVYAAGLSQGAIEALLLAGLHPERFAGVLSINPIADFIPFYRDTPSFQPLMKTDFGGTPETARKEYEERSPAHYAKELARVPATIYWADNDEIIAHGPDRQGGPLCAAIRQFHPAAFKEVRHSHGHGYPFYGVNLAAKTLEIYPRSVFLTSVREMLQHRLKAPKG